MMRLLVALIFILALTSTTQAGPEQDFIIGKLNEQYQGYRSRAGGDTTKRNLLRTVYSNASKQIARMPGLSGRTVAEAAIRKMSEIVSGITTNAGDFGRAVPAPRTTTPTQTRTCYMCNPGNNRSNQLERVCMTQAEYGSKVGGAARNGNYSSCKPI